jgi:radical SAM protein with 4Fe4S-binding SPASM domain
MDAGLDYLILAIDGATAATYEKIRVNGRFEQVVGNVRRFLGLKRERRSATQVIIQFILMEENKHEVQAFVDAWKGLRPDVIRIKPYVDLFGRKGPTRFARPCFYLWRQSMIDWDGTVFPCCVDTDSVHALGSVVRQTLLEIWNAKPLCAMRRAHILGRQQDIDICRNCDMHQFTVLEAFGATLIDGYTIKKLLPWWETFRRLVMRGPISRIIWINQWV